MRISEAQADDNRRKVLGVAAKLFRERGFQGVAVGDLMKAAGFTHGGFYNHFKSKQALIAQALAEAFHRMDAERARASSLVEMVTRYLSEAARRAPGMSCPAAALGGDVSRQPNAVKQVFADGFERMIDSIVERLPESEDARSRAIDLLTRMVGALMLSRAIPSANPLGSEILSTSLDACLRDLPARDRG
jgi:TetR/AcrR family transcriptional repressor of nem operon